MESASRPMHARPMHARPMHALVLGHRGMLGSEVVHYLRVQRADVYTLGSRCMPDDPGPFMSELQCAIDRWSDRDAVFNCIGAIPQRCSEDAMPFVNGILPHLLAMAVRGVSDAVLIHPSTDCVFTGARPRGMYGEAEEPNAPDPYGRSKALGDMIAPQPNVLILRASVIGVGPREAPGRGLLAWLLRQQQGTTVPGYMGATWNGITTREWTRVALAALARGDRGLRHVSCSTPVTKCELLKLALRTWSRDDITVADTDTAHCDRSLLAVGDYVRSPIETQLVELWSSGRWRDWQELPHS